MADSNSEGLFRTEAVKFHASRLQGEVVLRIRSPWLLLGWLTAGLVIVLAISASFVVFHRKVGVSGSLVPVEGISRLVSIRAGTVDRILVGNGDEVRAGQVLMTVRWPPQAGYLASTPDDAAPTADGRSLDGDYAITAPADMIVGAIDAFPGQQVSAGDTVIALMPKKWHLEAELLIPSRAIGFVRAGQVVSLQYEAFSSREYGSGAGKILSISLLPLVPDKAMKMGRPVNEPVYKARVSLDEDHVWAYGEKVPLRPGMSLNAEITLGERTITEWLLDPLYASGKP